MTLKQIYRLYPKQIWTLTLITFIFIARKTFFNVAREVGSYATTVDSGTSLALLGISMSMIVIIQNSSKISRFSSKVFPFLAYYIFATLSFLWAGSAGTILFKGIEVLCSFMIVCLTIYYIRSLKQALLYIVLLATASTAMDMMNKIIKYGFSYFHTNAYTMTSMIALLLLLSAVKHKIFSFKEMKYLIFYNAFMLVIGTSSASYISFVIGLVILMSSQYKRGMNIGIVIFICITLYFIYS